VAQVVEAQVLQASAIDGAPKRLQDARASRIWPNGADAGNRTHLA